MSIFGIKFSKKPIEKEKASTDEAIVKENISSEIDSGVKSEINESVNDTVDDMFEKNIDNIQEIAESDEGVVLESSDSDVDVIDLSDLGVESIDENRANEDDSDSVDSCDTVPGAKHADDEYTKDEITVDSTQTELNEPDSMKVDETVTVEEDDSFEKEPTIDEPQVANDIVKKDSIDTWLTEALNEELSIESEEAELSQKSAMHDENISHEAEQVTHDVLSSHDFINKHLGNGFDNLLSGSSTAAESFLSINSNQMTKRQSYTDEREQIEINFDEVTSQLQRLKSIFNTKPYPPNELINHQLEKMSSSMPFDTLNVNAVDVDNIVKNQLLMIEAIQEKEMKIRVAEQDVNKAKAFINQLNENRTGLASEMIGLKFQKQLLENTVITLAKKFAESPDEHIAVLPFIDGDDLKNTSFIKAFEQWQESSDEGVFSLDSWWLMLFSKEIMSITSHGKEGHQVKHKLWYEDIYGIGDVCADMIENIILERYPNSRSAFAISIAQAVRSQLCEMAIFDKQCNETVQSDISGMHKIWKRFLGQLYLSSMELKKR